MDRDKIIKKAMAKLSLGVGRAIPHDEMKENLDELKKSFSGLKHNDVGQAKSFLKLFGNMVDGRNYREKEVQEVLAKAKDLGLIKKSIRANKYMERAWRSVIKKYRIRGFMLEN